MNQFCLCLIDKDLSTEMYLKDMSTALVLTHCAGDRGGRLERVSELVGV